MKVYAFKFLPPSDWSLPASGGLIPETD